MHHFEHRSLIQAPVEKVFAFHERLDAIQLLTPAILFPTIERLNGVGLEAGVELAITTGIGLRTRWHARHTAYEKNRLFVDEIVEGPMRRWRHEHRFSPQGSDTLLVDSIEFEPKFGPAWPATLGLRLLFAYRHRVTKRYCESSAMSS